MAKYKSINEAPKGWRSIDGVPLSLDQMNEMIDGVEAVADPSGNDFTAELGIARRAFAATHKKVAGQWTAK